MDFKRFGWVAFLLGLIWAVQAVNLLTGYALNSWLGVIPRALRGLDGVVFMPLLHGSVSHAVSNSVPLLVLGGLMTATARRDLAAASAVIVILGGLGVWLFGRTALHVGASGLIFGWFGYLVARGLVERRIVPVLTAAAVVLAYGSLIWGVLPGTPGVSWEAHLFGALSGVIAAFLFRERTSG